MKTWTCPGCEAEVDAIASEVRHRCPSRRLAWVAWVHQPERELAPWVELRQVTCV